MVCDVPAARLNVDGVTVTGVFPTAGQVRLCRLMLSVTTQFVKFRSAAVAEAVMVIRSGPPGVGLSTHALVTDRAGIDSQATVATSKALTLSFGFKFSSQKQLMVAVLGSLASNAVLHAGGFVACMKAVVVP